MNNKALLPLMIMVILGVALSHLGLRDDDNGTLLMIDNRPIDIRGEFNNMWISLRRDCSNLKHLDPSDTQYLRVKNLIKSYSPPSSASAKLFTLIEYEGWILAEAEFVDLLPAVILIKTGEPSDDIQIIPNAIWSGFTKPWKTAPYVRSYISRQRSDVPQNLLDCFDPQSNSFN